MTLFVRRLYYTVAIVIFLTLAPIILATAKGYQWAGWRSGFVPTGVLVISTAPKATVSINGRIADETTKLTKRLRPGQYAIALNRPGYIPWKTLVGVKANAAHVIGPVVLFPAILPVDYQGPAVSEIMTDPLRHISVGARNNVEGWELEQLWPRGASWAVSISDQPQTVWFSPKERLLVIGTKIKMFVTTPGAPETPWMIDPVNQVFWGDRGDAVFYAMRAQRLLSLDSLARTETVLAERTSAGWFDRQIWSTETTDGQTLLYRQAVDALEPILARDFVGRWLIEIGLDGVLLVRNQDDHQTIAYTANKRSEPLALGVVDQWWWPDKDQPPLWQSGAQLYTLDDRGQPMLLERGPESYQAVYWLVPRHILVSDDGQSLTIRSVSSRQGRGIILKQQLAAPAESRRGETAGRDPDYRFGDTSGLLGVDRNRKVLILRISDVPSSLYTLAWE